MESEPFSKAAFHTGSHDRVSHPAANGDSELRWCTRIGLALGRNEHDERPRRHPDPIPRDPAIILGRAQAVGAAEALPPAPLRHLDGVDTASRARPLARRLARIERPPCVFIRARNPWVRRRRMRLG